MTEAATIDGREVIWFENYDIQNIVTPVKADTLERALLEANYDQEKTSFLVSGFREGFSLKYGGPIKGVHRTAPNLPFTVGDKIDLWNKVMKEVGLKRFAGPFKKNPFDDYIQSPIGLVLNDNGKDTRLIFHLSFLGMVCLLIQKYLQIFARYNIQIFRKLLDSVN